MILESRFAPSVSMRSLFMIALLALFVLPSFVQSTKAEVAAGSNSEATATSTGKPNATTTSELPYVIKFEQGATHFLDGDKISILEVRGTADTFTPGNIYWIKGAYTLASHDQASLAAFTTAKNAAEGRGKYFKVQMTEVTKGEGKFAVYLPMLIEGWPHISFYPADGGEGFGDNYFGTGDSVLKRGWWEPTPTIFVFGSLGLNMLRKFPPGWGLEGQSNDTIKFKEMLKNAKPGDTILLLLSLETSSRVPAEFPDLMLLSWPEIESLLKQGQTVFKQGKVRDMNVFLLATPTTEGTRKEFQRLVAEHKFIPDFETTTTAQTPDYRKDSRYCVFVFGTLDQKNVEVLNESAPWTSYSPHNTNDYKETLKENAKPGDIIILLLSLDDPGRVPEEFSDLMPLSWPETESLLKQGQTVFKQGKARDMNVFLLATPTTEDTRKEFRRLLAEGKFTPGKGETTK